MDVKAQENPRKLSPAVVLISGLICATLLAFVALSIHFLYNHYSPSLGNSERLLKKGKYSEALSLLNKVEVRDPFRSREMILRGKILFGMLTQELSRENWGSYGVNSQNWISHPVADQVEQIFVDVLSQDSGNVEARLLLGNLYKEQGRFEYARQQFSQVLELDEENSEAMLALGVLYAETDQLEKAEQVLRAAWLANDKDPRIAKNIAFFYRFYRNAPESSIVWFNRYLNLNPHRDLDVNQAKLELENLLARYPEFEPQEPQHWREQGRKFVPKR